MNQKQAWNISIVFLVFIFLLAGAGMIAPEKTFSERENRSLATAPKVTLSGILSGDFEEDYEESLKDQFVFRNQWIALRTMAERVLQKQEAHGVYFAKDDYLIEKHPETFQTPQADSNVIFLTGFIRTLEAQFDPSHLSVMIVPNAVKILDEKLPAFASPYDEETYLARIRSGMPDGVWFDASSVLEAHEEEDIFYRTDHHWTTLGAFYAFQSWAKEKGIAEVKREDYEVSVFTDAFEGTVAAKVGIPVKADRIEKYTAVTTPQYELVYNQSDDIRHTIYQETALDTRDKYAVFFGGNYGLIETTTRRFRPEWEAERRLLVIKDSYAHCFAPFLLNYFDQIDFLDLRYFNQSLSSFMEEKDYTDVLFLYNASGFAEDTSLIKLTM